MNSMSEKNTKGIMYVLLAAIFWSTGGVLIKFIPWNAMAINGIRSAVALGFFFVVQRKIKVRVNKTILLAAICLAMNNILYVYANKMTTAANAIVLQYLSPIFVLIFSSIKERKLPSLKQVIIVLTAFLGMALFFFDQLDAGKLLGNILAIVAGLFFAGIFFVNSLPESSSNDSSMIGFVISFVVGLPFCFQEVEQVQASAVIAVLVLGIVQVGLAYYVFGKGSKLVNPVTASLIGMIEAILNPLWVLLLYGEQPGRWALVGSVLILGSIACWYSIGSKE